MSKKCLFYVYDNVAKYYAPPQAFANRGAAIRAIIQSCKNNPDSQLAQHPTNYDLFEIGQYDEINGQVYLHSSPEALGNIASFQ